MMDQETWQRRNDEYLATALAWLRERLEALAPAKTAEGVGWLTVPDPHKRSWLERMTSRGIRRLPAPVLIEPPSESQAKEPVSAPEFASFEESETPPALMILARRLGLSRFERDVLLLTIAMELDTRMATLCARVHDDPSKPHPTFAMAMALFDAPTWDALSPERPLRYWRLIEVSQSFGQPLTGSALRADERIANYVKGLNYLDDRLTSTVAVLPEEPAGEMLPEGHARAVEHAIAELQWGVSHRVPLIQLCGPDPATRRLIAARVGRAIGRQIFHLTPDSIPGSMSDVETLARLWDREARLMPVALYVEEPGDATSSDSPLAGLERLAARMQSLLIVASREPRSFRGVPAAVVDVPKPTGAEQQTIWRDLLGESATGLASRLSGQFDLSLPAIHRVAERCRSNGSGESCAEDRVWSTCLAITRPQLDQLAQRIDVRATWNDLVLPPEQLTLLRQMVAQVAQRSRVYHEWGFSHRMNRGLGISALFSGESGTGKTMAAEVMAQALQLDLYRIDLSGVVNKYIGETEKNLRRVFDAAEAGGAILLFDEADALFGKRSEVKDSHDRYANVEINYLLQRLEAYRGLAILTTNMKGAMDSAFLRRLRFVVDFPFPGVSDRGRMWRQAFPSAAEVGPLDYERLARFSLTGGSIHNIALNAAFLAAHAGEPISMRRVLEAARGEFRKVERPVNESEFRWLEPVGGAA